MKTVASLKVNEAVKKRRMRAMMVATMTPVMPVRAPHSALTAEREKEPVTGEALKQEPKKLARPRAI